jgi:DoxX-like protein
MSIQHLATLVLEAVLALFTIFVAYAQATRMPAVVKSREHLHYPQWYWNLSTVLAVLGAIGLLVGLFIPVVGAAAILWMVAYFVVAVLTHLSRADVTGVVPALVFLLIGVGLAALRWGDITPLLALFGMK